MCRSDVGLVPDKIQSDLAANLREATAKRLLVPITVDGNLTRYTERVGGYSPSSTQAGRLLLFTSGTTSNRKAIVLNGDRLWSSAVAWAEFHSLLGAESRFYNILPMSYLGGLFNTGLIPLACRGSAVLSDAFSRLMALKFWREVKEYGVNTLWLTPTMLRSLMSLHARDIDIASTWVRIAFLGMAPIGLAEKKLFEETFGIPLLENFALSETTFLTSEEFKIRLKREPGSVGRVLPWVILRLNPLSGDPTKAEIEVKTPFLLEGYLDSDGEVRLPLTADGFFRTGDLGEFGGDGLLLLKGRCKDIIKKGGYLVSLRELEEIAEGHPLVKEAAAVGVPHEFYGEAPVLCVELTQGASSSLDALSDLRELLRIRLAQFKWPDEIVVVEVFPRTESGKAQKWILTNWLASRTNVVRSILVQ
jgi:acyl-CoA synthetase (AMP-forming)/AMP-acid ligase II